MQCSGQPRRTGKAMIKQPSEAEWLQFTERCWLSPTPPLGEHLDHRRASLSEERYLSLLGVEVTNLPLLWQLLQSHPLIH